jgi:hypothetical protein
MEWRKNLYQFEENPPGNSWKNIRERLDEDVPMVREALENFEEVPPAQSWKAISASLDNVPVVAPVRWYRRPAVITAAAAVLAGIIFFSAYLSQNETNNQGLSASVLKPVTPKATVPSGSDSFSSASADVLTPPVSIAEQPPSPSDAVDTRNEKYTPGPVHFKFDRDDENYIYLTTSTGELKRVSYKFEELIPEIRRQDGEIVQQWKNKLATSAFIPAGNNFFDIAEMIRLMEEERP